MRAIVTLGALIAIGLLAFTYPKNVRQFVFHSADRSRNVHVNLADGSCAIVVNKLVWWTVEKPVSVAWVGFSSSGNRMTVLTCSGNEDFPTTIQRLEFPAIWRELWPGLPTDFAESDSDLIRSLRHTFGLSHIAQDSAVLGWFCEGGGENELRKRGAWPKSRSDVVALPQRASVARQ